LGLAALLGILFGLGVYTLDYAEGTAYLADAPEACLNCHVMREPFEGWIRSSHKAVAVCNDCHTLRGFPDKWLVKGLNGWKHSWAFTTGNFADPIRIREFNARIVQQNCVACHQELVSQIHRAAPGQELSCVACHGNVGHGE
jgi:cytochrome c nitrite reductase small subunit